MFYYLYEFFSEISVEPAIEDWVTDTGAHGQGMTESKSEKVVFRISNGDDAKISYSEEEM